MAVDDEIGAKAHTWREEVDKLFGLRWDTLVEWVVIAWASAWLYSSWVTQGDVSFPRQGPVEWIASLLQAFSIEPPGWLTGIAPWLTDPGRPWLLGLVIVLSAVFATLSVRRYDRVGLRFLALVGMMIGFEIGGSAWPAICTVLLAAVPAVAAATAGFVESARTGREERRYSFYLPSFVLRRFIEGVVLLFLMPVLATFILLYNLVVSYRTELPYDPSEELAQAVAWEFEHESVPLGESDAFLMMSAVAAIQAAGSSSRSSRRIAGMLNVELRQKREARQWAEKQKRDREFDALRRG